jgi:hypothetical protein
MVGNVANRGDIIWSAGVWRVMVNAAPKGDRPKVRSVAVALWDGVTILVS